MPPKGKRFYKRKRRGRRNNRVRYASSLATVSNPIPSPLGRTFKATLPYSEYNIQVNPTSGGLASTYIFSANGMYDPNITGVGHQPLGFDQIMTMYDHFTVIGSRITVTFVNNDISYNQFAGVRLTDNTTPETDPNAIMENGAGKHALLGIAGKETNTATMEHNCSVSRFLGRPNIMSNDDLRGSAVANPVEQVYYQIWAAPNTAVDASTVTLTVKIDYIAIFTEPKTLASS